MIILEVTYMEDINHSNAMEEIDKFQEIYNSIDASLFPQDHVYTTRARERNEETRAQKEKRAKFWSRLVVLVPTAALFFQMFRVAINNNKVSSMARQVVSAPFVATENYKGIASNIAYANNNAHALVYSYFKELDYSSVKMDKIFENIGAFINSDPSLQNEEVRRAIGYNSFAAYLHGNGFTTAKDFINWGDKLLIALGIDDTEERSNMISEYLAELTSTQDETMGGRRNG